MIAQTANKERYPTAGTVGQSIKFFSTRCWQCICENVASGRLVTEICTRCTKPSGTVSLLLLTHGGNTRQKMDVRLKTTRVLLSCMTNYVNATVCGCQVGAKNRRTTKRQQKMRLFPPIEPLQFVPIYIIGPLPKTSSDSQLIMVMRETFSKLTKAFSKKRYSKHSRNQLHQRPGGELRNKVQGLEL